MMFVDATARYPKGMYQVKLARNRDGSGDIEGFSLLSLYTGRKYDSDSPWRLLQVMEEDFAANRFPQNTVSYHSWSYEAGKTKEKTAGGSERQPGLQAGATGPAAGPTFIIQVLYRQNATWQGNLQWLEGRQKRQFRSVNELFKLMDEAVRLT